MDSLIIFVIVVLALIWFLDFIGVLEIASLLVTLIGGAIAGLVWLVSYLIRRAAGPAKPQP